MVVVNLSHSLTQLFCAPNPHTGPKKWVCKRGMGEGTAPYKSLSDNSEKTCGFRCQEDSKCAGFEYTTSSFAVSQKTACRLFNKNTPAYGSARENRQYCVPSKQQEGTTKAPTMPPTAPPPTTQAPPSLAKECALTDVFHVAKVGLPPAPSFEMPQIDALVSKIAPPCACFQRRAFECALRPYTGRGTHSLMAVSAVHGEF